ncbi:MAG: hypothetical protein WA634_15165 [Silvibacterium sp.]
MSSLRSIFASLAVTAILMVGHTVIQAQSIQVRVLNARNGNRVPNERVSVQIKGEKDATEYKTDSEGNFYLQLDPSAYIFVATEWWVTCRHITPRIVPYVSVATVIDKGFTEENTCGHAKEETIKGKYIIFARKASFIEKFNK